MLIIKRERKREITPQGKWPYHSPLSSILRSGFWTCITCPVNFFVFLFALGCACSQERLRQTKRGKVINLPPSPGGGHSAILSLPFSPGVLGTYAHAPGMNLKPLVQDLSPCRPEPQPPCHLLAPCFLQGIYLSLPVCELIQS